jgi:hypothetical protein
VAGPTSTFRNLLFAFLVTSFILLLGEGCLSVIRAIRAAASVHGIEEEKHSQYDEELGWRNLREFHNPSFYGEGLSYTTNAQGFRGAKEDYTVQVPAGRYRIICLGDSFTMGYGVDDAYTYPAQLESLVPKAQVVNMGLGGYGIGQNYLWYKRDGVGLEANLLLFAFIDNDFQRLTQPSFMGYAKPLVQAQGDELSVTNVPVPRTWHVRTLRARVARFLERLALADMLRRLIPDSPARREPGDVGPEVFGPPAALIFQELAVISKERGQDFALVYLPTRYHLPVEPTPEARWLGSFSAMSQIPLIDLTREFKRLAPRALRTMFQSSSPHYSAAGNLLVARALQKRLENLFPRFPRRAPPGQRK